MINDPFSIIGFRGKNKKEEVPQDPDKKYFVKVEVVENGVVVFTKETPTVKSLNRLEAVQTLDEHVRDLWNNLLQTFHFVNKIGSK